ncbi:CAP-associated domain-containing protein [Liquorilactobacillus sicerae]|uniref:CAP-associated domain-containing protein n=1 Tax=Liquorilactobacillus sicerae TaxID=1416943 RepID=UPI00247FCEEE|nr:CAP-associated domain-containing protein [Liquorilactobacillus sicerae]
MKKRICWKNILNFSLVLIILLGYLYFRAAINQQKSSTSVDEVGNVKSEKNGNDIKLTTPKVKALATSQLAAYIGKSSNKITADFGQPADRLESADNVEWWLYNLNGSDYLKVGIDQYTNQVCDIFTIGQDARQGKLKVGMSFKKLLKLTTLYANFKFNYREQTFQYELSERALNQHPLISFKNGSYAIAYLQPGSKEVYALEYLNTDMLVKKKLYHLVAQVPLPVQYQGKVDWDNLAQMLPVDLLQQVNAKRLQEGRQTLQLNNDLNLKAQSLLTKVINQPSSVVAAKHATNLKQIANDEFSNRQFVLLQRENFKKQALADLSVASKSSLMLVAPFYSSLTIFEKPVLLKMMISKLITGKSRPVGVAYSHGILIVIAGRSEN